MYLVRNFHSVHDVRACCATFTRYGLLVQFVPDTTGFFTRVAGILCFFDFVCEPSETWDFFSTQWKK